MNRRINLGLLIVTIIVFLMSTVGSPTTHAAGVSVDPTFNPGSGVWGSTVYAVAVQSNGKVLIGGDFTEVNGIARSGIARLNVNGSLD